MKQKIKIYFSDFYNVDPKVIKNYGAFNISLISDLPLFIDPFMLFTSEEEIYQQLHEDIIKYVLFLKSKSHLNLPKGLLKGWFCFPEVKQNWFGYSKGGNFGRGLGPKFAVALKTNFITTLRNFGEEGGTGTHLEKLTLVKNGVGKDQISDFTCNLIHGFLAEYTEKFSIKNIDDSYLDRFTISKYKFNYNTQTWASKSFILPRRGNDYVLLTPIDILTKDENWIAQKDLVEDFSGVLAAVPNDQLRAQINNYFIARLPTKPTKEHIAKGVEKTLEQFPEVIDYFIASKEADSDGAQARSAEKVSNAIQLFVKNLSALANLILDKTDFYETPWSSKEEAFKRINYLKHVIEMEGGWKLFYVNGEPVRREPDLHIMFKLVWFASKFDSNAEVDNGRGPADFVISFGSSDKTIIEFKLAKNSKLEKNLKSQAELYSDASRATNPPYNVIVYFNEAELTRVLAIISRVKLNKDSFILIDASDNKPSGSKA
jgi:hypothetical protein